METENNYLSSRIEEYLDNLIKSGQLKAGDRLPSERKIALRFQTSISPVRQATRMFIKKGILVNQPRRGVFVKRETLSRTQTNRIGLLFCHTRNSLVKSPYFGGIIAGIDEEANARGESLVWQSLVHPEGGAITAKIYDMMDIVDGFIIVGVFRREYDEMEETLLSLDKPVVVLDYEGVSDRINSVLFDSTENAEKVMRFLLSLGHRRIGFVGWGSRVDTLLNKGMLKRFQVYKNTMSGQGIAVDPDWVVERFYFEEPEILKEMLQNPNRPTALFCGTAQLAMHVCGTARDLGLRVPDDLTVAGIDDSPEAQHVTPPLTTIAVPTEQMGRAGVKRLLEMKEEKKQGLREIKKVVLPGQLVERGSHAAYKNI